VLKYLYKADAALDQTIPTSIRKSTEWLLRLVNCYYSNKIEGNPTHPKELLKTQDGTANTAPTAEVAELLKHLEVQVKIKNNIQDQSLITTQAYIKSIHRDFYDGLGQEHLFIKDQEGNIAYDKNGDKILLQPGEYRSRNVKVGRHVPPSFEELTSYMSWVESAYNLETIYGLNPVVAAAGLHHRLAWIHPFQDGNGRTIRLVLDSYMKNSGFNGYGLWSITRGMGRKTGAYYRALSEADKANSGHDGRGILSQSGLVLFTKYFIDTALDQVNFFTELLEPRKLGVRIDYYFELRAKGGFPSEAGEEDLPLLKITARDIYKLLLESLFPNIW